MIEPTLHDLAFNYLMKKKICRKCYSRNSIKNIKCRKKKCGHYKNLRLKKIKK